MTRPGILSDFEQLLLLAALHLEEDAYGPRLREVIEERGERRVSRGSIYVTLDRLEERGLLRSERSDPSPKRGGRPRRTVRVTAEGLEELRRARRALMGMWEGLEEVLAE